MSWIYTSIRVGKNSRPFKMYKFRTLKEGTDKTSPFAQQEDYTLLGKLLRKTKLDELPQLINVLKGEMSIVGPRPEEQQTIDVLPSDIRKFILSVKPGLVDLASLYFFDEEFVLQQSSAIFKDYWTKVKPIKIILQCFYIHNRCPSLKLWILWTALKMMCRNLLKK